MRKSAPLFCALLLSLSARRAWIEISVRSHPGKPKAVALRKESVDRNVVGSWRRVTIPSVALRKESVDRNQQCRNGQNIKRRSLSARRAWIEIIMQIKTVTGCVSLSARRAWIEMLDSRLTDMSDAVALRKESVDRNGHPTTRTPNQYVALRKESVDRNFNTVQIEIVKMQSLSARRAWIEIWLGIA